MPARILPPPRSDRAPPATVALAGAVLAALIGWAAPAGAQDEVAQAEPAAGRPALEPVERPVEDELVLEVRLGRYVLSDAMLGYLQRGGVLLGLGEFTRALDFAIDVDPADGQATGWFMSEDRRFALDLVAGEAVVEGRAEPLPPGLVELGFDDIYVDTTVLARWFPVDLDFDLSRLLVTVVSREPLPLEERLERARGRAGLGRAAYEQPSYPRQEVPYAAIDWPFVDTSWAFDYDSEGRGADLTTTTLVTGDVLYTTGTLFVASTAKDTISDARLTLSRTDPDAGLLGPLGLTDFALGDVFTPQLPLVASQQEGRGAAISSLPLSRATEFDTTTLRGELPLGWEVELYRNEILLDFRRSRADGRYEFEDVPLLYGLNVLILEFYGPQGQRRTEVQRFFIGPGQLREDEQHYRLAINQQDERTLPIAAEDGVVGPRDVDRGKARAFGEYERGVTRELSLAASGASYALDGKRHNYLGVGLRTTFAETFLRLDAVKDSRSGHALELAAQRRLYELNVSLEHDQFFRFVSERNRASADPIDSRSRLRLDGSVPEGVLPRIPFSFDVDLLRRESNRYDLALGNRVSAFYAGVLASNTLAARLTGGGGEASDSSLSGSALVNARLGALGLRGQLAYTVRPGAGLDLVSVTGDYPIDPDVSARFGVDHQLGQMSRTTVSGSLFWLFDVVDLGLAGAVDDDGVWRVGLTLSYGAGFEPRTMGLARRARGIADGGAVSARAYIDRDRDARFGEGDEPLEGVTFERQRDQATDADGIAFLTRLPAYQPTGIALDRSSLEDPYLLPLREGVEIVPRPGKAVEVDFPLTPTGEVDGTVFLLRGELLREVSNVALELLDAATGKVAAEARSQFDGFYLFELVPPGRYLLRVSPDQIARLSLAEVAPVEIEISGGGDIVSGVDFTLARAEE